MSDSAEGHQYGEGATVVANRIQRAHVVAEEVEARAHGKMMAELINNPKKAAAAFLTNILTAGVGDGDE